MKPNPDEFPHPPQSWGAWSKSRGFKPYQSLAAAKNAAQHLATGAAYKASGTLCDYAMSENYHIYSWDPLDERWVEKFVVKKGTHRSDHALWKRQRKKVEPATEDEVNEAITLLTGGA